MPKPIVFKPLSLPKTHADVQKLIHHAHLGDVPKAAAGALRKQIDATPASHFASADVKNHLVDTLKKIEEGATSIAMMAFGWTRELMEGTASVIRGRGTIMGPVSAELKALNKTGVSPASVVAIDPRPAGSPAAERAKVYTAQKQAIDDINGFDFLSQPPKGKTANVHTVLIKPGVNWGINGYPTATSPESTYATTRQTLEEAAMRGATVKVIIGDESGIEGKAWGATTMGNFELSGVLDGGVRAGLEQAIAKEAAGDPTFKGAKQLWDSLTTNGQEHKVTLEDTAAIAMAQKAGVKLVGFEDLEAVRVPVPEIAPGMAGNRHFPDGVLIPKIVRDEVTDILNVPKPPGRHALMGCAGTSGALKNHIGLLGGSDRVPMLHGPLDRVPGLNSGADGPKWAAQFGELGKKLEDPALSREDRVKLLKQLQGDAKWDLDNEHGPNMMLHEKIAELSSVFADKERFTVADMRKTVSSVGPDIGDTMDIGKVVASKHAATVDVIANSLLKDGYEHLGEPKHSDKKFDLPGFLKDPGDWLKNAFANADTPIESFYGRTFLEKGATAFDTLQIRAAMAYGITPVGREGIELKIHGDPRALGHITTPK